METSDKQFLLTFITVTAALFVLAIVVIVIANVIGGSGGDGHISKAQLAFSTERIRPVGQVHLNSDPEPEETKTAQPALEPKVAADTPAAPAGDQVYASACQACHAAGIAGAPKTGDVSTWTTRLDAGLETLYVSALVGKGAMPAKGGNPSLSDAEVKAAVDYMIESSR